MNEYVLCDMIYHLSNNKNNDIGWCYMSKQAMANELGLTKSCVEKMIKRLLEMDLLTKHEVTKNLQTSKKWDSIYLNNNSVKSTHTAHNLHDDSVKSTHEVRKKYALDSVKSTHNIYNDINTNINIDIIDSFKKEVEKNFKGSNQSKESFISYWTEKNKNGKTRFECEKFFDLNRRINTWLLNEKKYKEKEKSFAQKEKEYKYEPQSKDSLF